MHSAQQDSDAHGKILWNDSYRLTKDPNLWGDPPVPFTAYANELFCQNDAHFVLDLPCGDGRNLPPLAAGAPTVVGADSSRNAINVARGRVERAGIRNVILMESDIFATGFANDMFDGVFCCDVLGHLTKPMAAIRELLRACRPSRFVVANIFAVGDSTRGQNMVQINPEEEYIFDDRFYFKFYEKSHVEALLAGVANDAEVHSIELVRWTEPPHEGYREYEHEHESWLFAIRKR
jgi:SAM-dependent methyltransferase